MSRARGEAYRLARALGDLEALQTGGLEGYAKRRVRRRIYARWNGLLRRLLRGSGLSG